MVSPSSTRGLDPHSRGSGAVARTFKRVNRSCKHRWDVLRGSAALVIGGWEISEGFTPAAVQSWEADSSRAWTKRWSTTGCGRKGSRSSLPSAGGLPRAWHAPTAPSPHCRKPSASLPATPIPLWPVPVLLITSAAPGHGHRLSPALSVGSVMLDDTAETCAVSRSRSALGAGGWEFTSGSCRV